MSLRVVVDVFSGLPNPQVDLDGDEARAILGRLRPERRIDEGEEALPLAPPLGYRGVTFEQVGDVLDTDLPRWFRLAGETVFGLGLAHRTTDPEIEAFICGSAGPFGRLELGTEFFSRLGEERERFRELRRTAGRPWNVDLWSQRHDPHHHQRDDHGENHNHDDEHDDHHRCRCAPLYEPAWWNDGGIRQWSNNCYNYATNTRTDTFAQPGLAAGAQYASLSCVDVRAGAVADELIDTAAAENRCPHEGHLAGLVVAPGWDFHWYRKGRDGSWSHKPGGTPVTNVDNAAQPISDPRTADRGPYTDFCTFMVVMHGHVKIQ